MIFTHVKTFVLTIWALLRFFGHLEKFTMRKVGLIQSWANWTLRKIYSEKSWANSKIKVPNGSFLRLKSKKLLGEKFLRLFLSYVKTFVLKLWSLLQFFEHLEKFTMRKVGLIRVGLIGHLEKFTMERVGLIKKLKCQTADFSGSNQKNY